MLGVDCISFRHELLVPPGIARLVSADEKHPGPARIESVEDTVRTALVLNPQFAHVGELRATNCIGIRPWKGRSRILKHVNRGVNAILLFG